MKGLLEVLRSSAEWLGKRGVESPRLNAEHLLAHVLGKRRLDLYLEFDRPLSESELGPMRDLLRRRGEGEPLQHLLGTAEFCGRTFACDARALVPRPETEELVERVAARIEAAGASPGMLVDVGTGSGVIVVTLALRFPEQALAAVDLSPEALALARENAARHGVADRIRFIEGNLLASVEGTIGVVVANLPYIASGEIAGLSREVQRDPVAALDGGADGLDLIRRLAAEAEGCLPEGGLLALEIGHDQGAALKELLGGGAWRSVEVEPDLQGRDRFVFATHG